MKGKGITASGLTAVSSRKLCALLIIAATATLFGAQDPSRVVRETATIDRSAQRPDLPTLYVVGDSTARSDTPLRGWGSEVGVFFDDTKINVVNRAIGGRSSRTFITEGRWDKVLSELKSGDFVLVQFGHNDVADYKDPKAKGRPSIHGEGEETVEAIKSDLTTMETIHTFGWYMRKYALDTKAKGATPILLSMVPHKDWQDGKIVRKEQETFVRWTRNAAQTTGALFIDSNEIIARGLERLGPEKVEPFFADARTHSSSEGAKYNAAAVIVGMKRLKSNPLRRYLNKLTRHLPPTLTAR
jgi:lysophospholipase L1-like esterase